MATRQTKTPGATEPVEEVVASTTTEQADATLDAILGKTETKDQSTKGTSTASELVEDDATKKEYEEFLAWRNSKNALPTQHVPTSNATTQAVKRTRAVVGPNGWTQEEY